MPRRGVWPLINLWCEGGGAEVPLAEGVSGLQVRVKRNAALGARRTKERIRKVCV